MYNIPCITVFSNITSIRYVVHSFTKIIMDKPVNKVAVVVEITSDVVCPWYIPSQVCARCTVYDVDCFYRCWVGKKRLDLAIERLKDEFTFHILWKPFLLIPNVPDEGIPLKDYVLKRFGKSAAEKFTSENSPLHQNAAEVVSSVSRI